VLDTVPRTLTEEQRDSLEVLSAQVMKLLELRRRLALQAELKAQLQEALRTRERVLAVVSHDLRSPLGTVLMTADLLREMAEDPELHRAADRLERAGSTMRGSSTISSTTRACAPENSRCACGPPRSPTSPVASPRR